MCTMGHANAQRPSTVDPIDLLWVKSGVRNQRGVGDVLGQARHELVQLGAGACGQFLQLGPFLIPITSVLRGRFSELTSYFHPRILTMLLYTVMGWRQVAPRMAILFNTMDILCWQGLNI